MGDTKSGAGRKTRWCLMASVTLNLLVAGVLLGGMLSRHPMPPPQVGIGPFDSGLTEADRKVLTRMAEREGVELEKMPHAMERWLVEVLGLIAQENYDEDAVRAALSAQRKDVLSRIQVGEDLMVEWLGTLSPEARQQFVERIRAHEADPNRMRPGP